MVGNHKEKSLESKKWEAKLIIPLENEKVTEMHVSADTKYELVKRVNDMLDITGFVKLVSVVYKGRPVKYIERRVVSVGFP